jgi:hypothetical protein
MDREEITGAATEIMGDVFDIGYCDDLPAEMIAGGDSQRQTCFDVAVEKRFGLRVSSTEIGGFCKVRFLTGNIA